MKQNKSGAIKSIEQIKNNTQKKLTKLQSTAKTEKDSVSFAEIRKKNWYEDIDGFSHQMEFLQ
ncbi:hypothetical protein EMGBD3_08880 [Nitrosarchaeum sp.]|nr:hypothetical protein EMGBD3_08880 [Nitrosarchaeum sp.]